MQDPFLFVEFRRRLWTFAQKPGNNVSDHAEECSAFLLKQAKAIFGVKGGKEASTAVDLTGHLVHSESRRSLATTSEQGC